MRAPVLLSLALVLSGVAAARAEDGVVKVARPAGNDSAAVARRVQALEERLDSMWSLRQGPGVLNVDTMDRLSTRLLGVEARLASLEQAAGSNQAFGRHDLSWISSHAPDDEAPHTVPI